MAIEKYDINQKIAAIKAACDKLIASGAEKGTIDWQVAAAQAAGKHIDLAATTLYRVISKQMTAWKRERLGLRRDKIKSKILP